MTVIARLRHHPVIWGAVISGILIGGSGLAVAAINHSGGDTPGPGPTTPAPAAATTTPAVTGQILAPDAATPVKRCTVVTGTVTDPDPAGANWLLVQTTNGDYFIIGRQLRPDPAGRWQQKATIGGPTNVGALTYGLLLVHTDADLTAAFAGLAAGTPVPAALVAKARTLDQERVHRDPHLNC